MSNMKSSPSKPQRVLVEHSSSTPVSISTPAYFSLAKKAGKNQVLLSILEQVYCRGLLESSAYSKNTPEQQAFLRVNSFLNKGKAYEMDSDLVMETPVVPDGKKHMHIIKKAIKNHEQRNKQQLQEYSDPFQAAGAAAGSWAKHKISKALFGSKKKSTKQPKTVKAPETDQERQDRKFRNAQDSYIVRQRLDRWKSYQGSSNQPPRQTQDTENQQAAKFTRRLSKNTTLAGRVSGSLLAKAQEMGATQKRFGPWGAYDKNKREQGQGSVPQTNQNWRSLPKKKRRTLRVEQKDDL